VILQLENGQQLFYQDARKFGRLWLMADPAPVLAKLGPEPFDARFTPQLLATTLAGRQASIKALLLDQRLVAGVGNIYADEALFRAAIHPARAGGTLLPAEVDLLHRAILQVLNEGIASAGSSLGTSGLQNYSRPGGAPGGFQEQFNVFRRTGAPCRHCNTPIQRRVLAQRSTHFCPRCQR
jgi:formamidopyrimidine-DNA glycosylase